MKLASEANEKEKKIPSDERLEEIIIGYCPVLSDEDNFFELHTAIRVLKDIYQNSHEDLQESSLQAVIKSSLSLLVSQTPAQLYKYATSLHELYTCCSFLLTESHYQKLSKLLELTLKLSVETTYSSYLRTLRWHLSEDSIDLVIAIVQSAVDLKLQKPRDGEMEFFLRYTDTVLSIVIPNSVRLKFSQNEAEKQVEMYVKLYSELTEKEGIFIDRGMLGKMYYSKPVGFDDSIFQMLRGMLLKLEGINEWSEEKLVTLIKIIASNVRVYVENVREKNLKEMIKSCEGDDDESKFLRRILEDELKTVDANDLSVRDLVHVTTVFSIVKSLHKNARYLFEDDSLRRLSEVVDSCELFTECNSIAHLENTHHASGKRGWKPADDVLNPYIENERELVKYLPQLPELDKSIRETASVARALSEGQHYVLNMINQTILDDQPEILLASDSRKKRFVELLDQLLSKIDKLDLRESNIKFLIWTADEELDVEKEMRFLKGDVTVSVLYAFVRMMSSIALVENEEAYSRLEQNVWAFFEKDDQEEFLSDCVFAESFIASHLAADQLDLRDQAVWDDLNNVKEKFDQINISEEKKQIIIRWFVKSAIHNFHLYQHLFSNFTDLENCFLVLDKLPVNTLRWLCNIVFADFIKERPDSYANVEKLLKNLANIVSAMYAALSRIKGKSRIFLYGVNLKDLNYTSSFAKGLRTFLTMVFRINQELNFDEALTQKIVQVLNNVQTMRQLRQVKLVLQYSPDIDDLEQILKKESMPKEEHPTRAQFRELSTDEQLGWLKYYSVMRVRQGLGVLNYVLKNAKDQSDDALVVMLTAFSRIAVSARESKMKRVLLLLSHDSSRVRTAAVKALWFINQNPENKEIKDILFKDLLSSDDEEYQIALLETLSFYHFDDDDLHIWSKVAEKSHEIESKKLLKHYGLALARVPNEKSLLRALDIVNSDVWDEYNYCVDYHERDYKGDFLLFLHRPHWSDNRELMYRRIKRLLSVCKDINEENIPEEVNNSVKKLSEKLKEHAPANRYENVQITLPPKTFLLRGICPRHGEVLESRAVVDFIMKGAGSLELQDQRDDEASHAASNNIYSANSLSVVLHYYKKDSGILMAIKSEYYNQESYRGFTRTQQEGSRHFIFLRGIPLYAIEKVFFPESFKQSLEQLVGEEAIIDLQKDKEFKFNDLDKHRLKQMRNSLRQFFDRIVFVGQDDSMYTILEDHQIHELSDEKVIESTLKEHKKAELIAHEMGADCWEYKVVKPHASILDIFTVDKKLEK